MKNIQIEYKDIEELKLYESNPRHNDLAVDKVATSIKKFGFKVPLVIDKENVIITGHTRYKAAEQLGLKKLPVILADDLTPAQVKAFRIADNKTAELASWDYEALRVELEGLKELGVELDDTFFEEWEIDNILNGVGEIESFYEETEPKEKQEEEAEQIYCPNCGGYFEV